MAVFQECDLQHKPQELELFAEDEEVEIIPDFAVSTDGAKILGIGGHWGPFQPGFRVKVPLWMATYLYQRKQCRILTPSWLSVEYLQGAYEEERNQPNTFYPLPNHYLEMAHILLIDARGCFSALEHMQSQALVAQLRRLRYNKINDGLAVLEGPMTVKINDLCAMEVNTIRPFFLKAQDRYLKMSKMDYQNADGTASQPDDSQL